MTTRLPGLDQQGFVPLASLREVAQQLERSTFLDRYPFPALVVLPPEGAADASASGKGAGARPLTVAIRSVDCLRYVEHVAFLRKRPGTPFAQMISLGRTTTNDLVVDVNNVSKFHGYFEGEGEEWHFIDHGSTNGTLLNEERLEPRSRARLRDGDRLRFGLELSVLYLLPSSLWARLRRPPSEQVP